MTESARGYSPVLRHLKKEKKKKTDLTYGFAKV
jgi:hypothetical protein